MNIEHEIRIDRAPEALWPWLIETERVQRWNPSIVSDEATTPGPTGVGTRTKMKLREGSKIVDYETELTAYEPDSLVALEMRGGNLGASPMLVRYALSPAGRGTELRYQATWRPRGLMLRLMSPVISIVARRECRRSLARLKEAHGRRGRALRRTEAGPRSRSSHRPGLILAVLYEAGQRRTAQNQPPAIVDFDLEIAPVRRTPAALHPPHRQPVAVDHHRPRLLLAAVSGIGDDFDRAAHESRGDEKVAPEYNRWSDSAYLDEGRRVIS